MQAALLSTIGAARLEDATEIVSLGGVFVTPVFVFYRSDETITRFAQFLRQAARHRNRGHDAARLHSENHARCCALDSSTRLTELSRHRRRSERSLTAGLTRCDWHFER